MVYIVYIYIYTHTCIYIYNLMRMSSYLAEPRNGCETIVLRLSVFLSVFLSVCLSVGLPVCGIYVCVRDDLKVAHYCSTCI